MTQWSMALIPITGSLLRSMRGCAAAAEAPALVERTGAERAPRRIVRLAQRVLDGAPCTVLRGFRQGQRGAAAGAHVHENSGGADLRHIVAVEEQPAQDGQVGVGDARAQRDERVHVHAARHVGEAGVVLDDALELVFAGGRGRDNRNGQNHQRRQRHAPAVYRPTPAVSSTSASSRKFGMTSSAKSCIISSVASWLPPFMPEQTMPAFSSSEKTFNLSRTAAGLP